MIPRLTKSTGIKALCFALALTLIIILLAAKKPWDILAKIGTPEDTKDFVAIYEWWAAAINAVLLIILGLTTKWWLRNSTSPPERSWLPTPTKPRWFWPLVIIAMALSAFFGTKRIAFSLWDDEDSSLRRVIHGEYRAHLDGTTKFKQRTWTDALWNYRKPANHQLQTILSKASLTVWQTIARPTGLTFSERAVRLPGYLAAILSVAAIAILLHRLGFARAAVVAAFLLALHPWHVRYATELRGYIFTLLFTPLTLYCLLQAIENGRWRWWLAFAASECALLYAYPGCLYILVAANACGLVALWARLDGAAERLTHLPRLFVSSLLAAMVYLQLMLPCLPQLARYFETERALGSVDTRWHYNLLGHLVSGIPWNNSDAPAAGYPELLWMLEAHPWMKITLITIPGILLSIGLIRLLTSRPVGWMATIVLLVPALAVYLISRKNNIYLYEWYLIFVLPGLVACVALGADWPTRLLDRTPWARRFVTPAFLFLIVAGYAAASQPGRQWLLTHPLQPLKDAVLATRPTLDPNDPRQKDILTVGLGVHLETYDAHVLSTQNVATLLLTARHADTEKKTLFITTGNDRAVSIEYPELRAIIRDPRYFDSVATLRGLDPTLDQFVWRYKPGTLASDPTPAP
jgi:hypothetical protein